MYSNTKNSSLYKVLSDPFFFSFPIFLPLIFFISILGAVIAVLIPMISIILIWFASEIWVAKQMSKYEVDYTEFAAYYSRFISTALKKREAAKKTVKEDYNKEALKRTKQFLRAIKEQWTVGNFRLVKDVFAQPLKEFRLGLQYRVIPSLKGEDENQIRIVKDAISTFEQHCKNLQIANIIDFNKAISTLPDKQPKITGIYKKLADYFSSHKNLRGSVYLIIIISICVVFAYSSTVHFQIPREYAYGGTIAIFVALLELIFHKR